MKRRVCLQAWASTSAMTFAVLTSVAQAGWVSTTSMDDWRTSSNSGVTLPDGRVVFASGNGTTTCAGVIYNPENESWMSTSAIPACLYGPTVLLETGRVLTIGSIPFYRTPALLDTESLSWSVAQPMEVGPYLATLSALPDGRILMVGRISRGCEIYDPWSDSWSSCQTLQTRFLHTATVLLDGRVLVVGGTPGSAEIYDSSSDTWSLTGPLAFERTEHAAALLNDGRVLVVGGRRSSTTAEIFDPATSRWSQTARPNWNRITGHVMVTLLDGRVLLVGGGDWESGVIPAAEIYDSELGTWSLIEPMNRARGYPLGVRLLDGRVLLAGGLDNSPFGYTATAEIFSPEKR